MLARAELIIVAVASIVPIGTTAVHAFAPFDVEAQLEEQDFVDRLARTHVDELASTLPAGLTSESVLTTSRCS